MKVQELGNIVGRPIGASTAYLPCTVHLFEENTVMVDKGQGKTKRYDVRLLRPIPLTEEWIMKFELKPFQHPDHKEYVLDDELCRQFSILRGNSENFDFVFAYNNFHKIQSTTITYVHQLQNLYFALMSEELTIKEKVHHN